MKHAYLILAHNDFPVLEILLQLLDDTRNDIYVHFDKKTSIIPKLKTLYSNLYILQDRVNVSWGDVSVIEAEYKLFSESFSQGPYAYYHLLSGVDLPLANQDYIHTFFKENNGREFISYSSYDYSKEVDRKVNYYHLFPKEFRKKGGIISKLKSILRAFFLRIQMMCGLKRHALINFRKGTQWVSVTHDFVFMLIQQKDKVLTMYKNTFCPDEIYKQTICWNSIFQDKIYCRDNEAKGSLRMIGWCDGQLPDWEIKDYDKLMASDCLFARKFSSKNGDLPNLILKSINR